MGRYVLGTLKENHFFIGQDNKKHNDLDKSVIDFFDAFNGYILIAGYGEFDYVNNSDCKNNSYNKIYFLKIYEGDNVYYSKDFGSTDITAVALNKRYGDCLEFCVGLKNGVIHNTLFSFSNGVRGTPHETILFNEIKEIYSICYLRHRYIVYSVGDCCISNIFSIHIDRIYLKKKWLKNVEVELKTVTSLKVISDHTLFGIMDGKIYGFEKNGTPYVVYSENNMKFIGYEYESVSKMMLITPFESVSGDLSFTARKIILVGVKEYHTYETEGCKRGPYISYNIGNFEDDNCDLPTLLKSSTIITKNVGKISPIHLYQILKRTYFEDML